jgi:hypothetical protein
MWFEVTPREYSMGVGFYGDEPGLLETFRKNLRERPDEFKNAADSCKKAGSYFFKRQYKRPFPDCPEGLEEYYNAKDVGFISFSGDLDDLKDENNPFVINLETKSKPSIFTGFNMKIKSHLDIEKNEAYKKQLRRFEEQKKNYKERMLKFCYDIYCSK